LFLLCIGDFDRDSSSDVDRKGLIILSVGMFFGNIYCLIICLNILYKIAFLFPWAFVQYPSSDIYREGFTTHSPTTFPHDFDSHSPFLKRIIFNCDFSFSHVMNLFHLFLTLTNCRTLILLPPFSCLPDVLQRSTSHTSECPRKIS
jgi:hypothetical protein